MTKKTQKNKTLYLVHRGIEFERHRVEAGPEPADLSTWPRNVIEHWLKVGVLSVYPGEEVADGSGTAG